MSSLALKILSPEEFDIEYESGGISPDVVQFCTTMTLTRFIKDVNDEDINWEQWVQTFPSHSVPVGRWPFIRQEPRYEVLPINLVRSNRDYFSWQMGMRDVLETIYTAAGKVIFDDEYSPLLYLHKFYDEASSLATEKDLFDLVVTANTYPYHRISNENASKAVALLMQAFGNLESIRQYFLLAKKRMGVQVIYGKGEYSKFYEGSIIHDIGSYFSGAKLLGKRIPLNYITAVLPLGEYEKEYFLRPGGLSGFFNPLPSGIYS